MLMTMGIVALLRTRKVLMPQIDPAEKQTADSICLRYEYGCKAITIEGVILYFINSK